VTFQRKNVAQDGVPDLRPDWLLWHCHGRLRLQRASWPTGRRGRSSSERSSIQTRFCVSQNSLGVKFGLVNKRLVNFLEDTRAFQDQFEKYFGVFMLIFLFKKGNESGLRKYNFFWRYFLGAPRRHAGRGVVEKGPIRRLPAEQS